MAYNGYNQGYNQNYNQGYDQGYGQRSGGYDQGYGQRGGGGGGRGYYGGGGGGGGNRGFQQRSSDNTGKCFVGGLSYDTNNDSLWNYFSQFGEVTDAIVVTDRDSGRSKGFGFVTFGDPRLVEKIISQSPHSIDGRQKCKTNLLDAGCNHSYM